MRNEMKYNFLGLLICKMASQSRLKKKERKKGKEKNTLFLSTLKNVSLIY